MHIRSWLTWSTKKFSLKPKPDPEKFPDTGPDLCKLTRADFEARAENIKSGTILAKHIAHLKHSVTGRPTSPLDIDCKIFENEGEPEGMYIEIRSDNQPFIFLYNCVN